MYDNVMMAEITKYVHTIVNNLYDFNGTYTTHDTT